MFQYEDKHVIGVYQDIATHFSQTRKHNKWAWIEKFLDNHPDPEFICDLGCGSGRNMRSNCFGVDNCPEFIKICLDLGLKAKYSDMAEIDLPVDSFDAIMCIAAFHHLENEDRRLQSLQEMKRILKPGGQILLSVWSINQPERTKRKFKYGDNLVPWNKDGTIYQRYYYIFELDEIKKLFQIAKFKIIDHSWDYGNEIFILEHDD